MSPDTFHDLLERDTEASPPPPGVGAELAEGRRRLGRRRLAATTTATLATVVVTGVGLAGGDRPRR